MRTRFRWVWVTVVLSAGMVFGRMFRDGEVVCFLGDSITNGGRYQNTVWDYYLTRFPGWTIRFVHAGRSGDSAGGSLGRLQEDVMDYKPTSVAIMMGMNDVGRGNYVANPDEKRKAAQQRSLDGYKANMEKVTERILNEANQPHLFLITPSPFDQTVVLERDNNQPGCNDGLGRCAAIVRELASKVNATVVDFHGPMTAFNLEQQKKDPKYTIVGADRVHPGAPGHLMMAWLFLKAQGVPSLVSRVAVDASAGQVTAGENATVTAVAKRDGGVTFTVLAKALPFPTDPAACKALEGLLPILEELSQETLHVTGLTAGEYALVIDGKEVGRYSAAALATGISLGANTMTPQYQQALNVSRLNARRRDAECQARNLLNTRRWMKNHHKINVDDPAAVQAHYDGMKDKRQYSAVMALNYIKKWPQYETYRKNAAELEKEMLASRTPAPHVYEVRPVGR
jgi:lysophospholipase L1-like esterase